MASSMAVFTGEGLLQQAVLACAGCCLVRVREGEAL